MSVLGHYPNSFLISIDFLIMTTGDGAAHKIFVHKMFAADSFQKNRKPVQVFTKKIRESSTILFVIWIFTKQDLVFSSSKKVIMSSKPQTPPPSKKKKQGATKIFKMQNSVIALIYLRSILLLVLLSRGAKVKVIKTTLSCLMFTKL